MDLYHLNRGDIPLGKTQAPRAYGHIREGRKHRQVYNRTSKIIHTGGAMHLADKAEIWITVDTEGLRLFQCEEIVEKLEIDPLYAKFLNSAGNAEGGLWSASFDVIPVKAFVMIEQNRNGNGDWREIHDASGIPHLEIRSVSSLEIETGQRIQRIPTKDIIWRLR